VGAAAHCWLFQRWRAFAFPLANHQAIGVRQLLRLLFAVTAAAGLAAPLMAQAPSPFDPPPFPTGGNAFSPQSIDGAPDAGPVSASGAPVATFVAPRDHAPSSPAGPTPLPSSSKVVPADAKPIEGSQIIARIEDQTILASDVLWQVNQMIAGSGRPIPPAQLAEIQQMLMRRQVLQLIDTKLLFGAFKRQVPPEALPNIEKQLAEPFEKIQIPRLTEVFNVKDRVELEAALAKSGGSLKVVQQQFFEKEVAGEWLRQKTGKPKPISHEEMLAYYQDHLKEYEYPAQVKWEELMVRFDKCKSREEAWQKIAAMGNDVWKLVAANPGVRGPVFASVAKAKSDGYTANKGGLQDWTTLGALKCEEMNQALINLELGQMSDGIESELGFHIVRVLERKAAGRTSFMEAQGKIRETLEEEQKAAVLSTEVAKLRKTARVWTVWDGELTGERLAEAMNGKSKR
jgi:hypothetical protein